MQPVRCGGLKSFMVELYGDEDNNLTLPEAKARLVGTGLCIDDSYTPVPLSRKGQGPSFIIRAFGTSEAAKAADYRPGVDVWGDSRISLTGGGGIGPCDYRP